MPLKKLPYERLSALIGIHLSTKEDAETQELIHDLASVRRRGYLTKPELLRVCRWKSARAIHQIRRNSEESVRRITRGAFRTRSERKRLEMLTSLRGVQVPMASAILMLTNPRRYGVIDIRVWQLLFKMGAVTTNKRGAGFNFKNWYRYIVLLRSYAGKYGVHVRDIERTLFRVHARYQKGKLYGG